MTVYCQIIVTSTLESFNRFLLLGGRMMDRGISFGSELLGTVRVLIGARFHLEGLFSCVGREKTRRCPGVCVLFVLATFASASASSPGEAGSGSIAAWGARVVGPDLSADFVAVAAGGNHTLGVRDAWCGDGVVDEGEECDDGNTNDGDGCSSTCTVEAVCDVMPGSCPNRIGPFFVFGGSIPVSLLGTATFDVSDVDASTVRLALAGHPGRSISPSEAPVVEDTGTPFAGTPCDCHALQADGIDDLSMLFLLADVLVDLGVGRLSDRTEVELVVTGELIDGTPFTSEVDCILVRRPRRLFPMFRDLLWALRDKLPPPGEPGDGGRDRPRPQP